MLKQFFIALLCGLSRDKCAQEVVVAREKPSASEQAAPASERTDSESATAMGMETQARKNRLHHAHARANANGGSASGTSKNQARVEEHNRAPVSNPGTGGFPA
jgi:hypothetical protein